MMFPSTLHKHFEDLFQKKGAILSFSSVYGGDINTAYRLNFQDSTSVFVKLNSADLFPQMFKKEALGLKLLSKYSALKIPEVLEEGNFDSKAYLALEFLDSSASTKNFWEVFGAQLAELHKSTKPNFGLDYDNYIGSLSQSNKQHKSWEEFFAKERILPQVKMAFDNRKLARNLLFKVERLLHRTNELVPKETPSLVHGDLWNGNYMISKTGNPALIDPAVYYGHREMDIAMTHLFGGFSQNFYDSYNQVLPMEKDWKSRLDFHNLYPLLVHVNLFGGAYIRKVEGIIKSYL